MRCAAPILAKGSTKVNPNWVPCSRCGYCLRTRQLSWSFRLNEEYEQSEYPSLFVTLTYDDDHLPWNLTDEVTLFTRDVQLWMKKARFHNAKYTTAQLRYYGAGEYGSWGRPHYHFIIFNCHPKTMLMLHDLWGMGITEIEPVRDSTHVGNYVAGYVVGSYSTALRLNKKPFSVCSKKPYLGHTYVQRMYDYHKRNLLPYLDRGKFKQALPRLFKNKIFEQWELNSMKQPALVQNELRLEAELHRLLLLNGPDFPAFGHYELTRIYNEQEILKKQKHNDNWLYSLRSGTTTHDRKKTLRHHVKRAKHPTEGTHAIRKVKGT